jgi:hypothetical protein
MRHSLILLAAVGLTACSNSPSEVDLEVEARSLVETFVREQKATLNEAVEAGPFFAVEVCSERAPEIAKQLSASSGWDVRRISLKPRNAENAIPDDWARSMLEDFEKRNEQGNDADTLVHAETVDGEFRFLAAQPVESICLLCHGTDIAPEIQSKLNKLYPDDRATGFKMGDLRGAFYLRKQLPGSKQ